MVAALLERLGVAAADHTQGDYPVHTPIDGSQIASVKLLGKAETIARIDQAQTAFEAWRNVPARVAASWYVCLVKCCVRTRLTLASWCPSKPARSPRKAWAKCRR